MSAAADSSTRSAWSNALMKYADMDKEQAKALGKKLGVLPLPGPESLTFISHDILVDLGIEDAGAIARVLLAAARSPAPETDYSERREDDERAIASMEFDTDADTSIVHINSFTQKGETKSPASPTSPSSSKKFTWTDVVGQDVAAPDAGAITDEFKQSKFLAACKKLQNAVHPGSLPVEEIPKGDRKSLWSILYQKKPLPCLLKDQDRKKRRGSIILRVCTLGVNPDVNGDEDGNGTEVTMTSLTNRLMLFVDADSNKIATVHRVDNRALHHLRDSFAPTPASGDEAAAAAGEQEMTEQKQAEVAGNPEDDEEQTDDDTFKSTLVSIFMCFQSEFLLALDECKGWLDESEQNIMDRKLAKSILYRLHNISRRASVYVRMIELSERVVRDACDYFDVEGEATVLEPRWSQLRDECNALNDRSLNALNLVIALAGYRTSDAVTVLTKISGALTPIALMTGYYGMNFEVLPELKYKYSYFIFSIAVITIVVFMLFFLKRHGL